MTDGLRKAARRVFWEAGQLDAQKKRFEVELSALQKKHEADKEVVTKLTAELTGSFTEWFARMTTLADIINACRESRAKQLPKLVGDVAHLAPGFEFAMKCTQEALENMLEDVQKSGPRHRSAAVDDDHE